MYDESAAELVSLRREEDRTTEQLDRLCVLERMFAEEEDDPEWDTPMFRDDPELAEWERSLIDK